ncbi:MAG: hypothetical protein V1858_02535 [Candidatus Gottesmanbacteria bacterium]
MISIIGWLVVINLFLFILSINKLRHSRKKIEFIYHWGFLLGAFTWEDLLVFSLFDIIFLFITYLAKDLRLGLLIWILFWIVRGSGETIYWFLQQFGQPSVYPHNQYAGFKRMHFLTGKVSLQQTFIIMQVFHQVITTFFLAALVLLLMDWKIIPTWF